MRKTLVFLVILTVLAAQAFGAKWYVGAMHNHTDFSDGSFSPSQLEKMVKQLGCDYLIATDHYNKVLAKGKVEEYLTAFGKTEGLLTVVGAEFPATEKRGPHILLLKLDGEVSGYRSDMGQEELLKLLQANSSAPIICAHPYWKGMEYDFSLATSSLSDGVEIFNYGDYVKTRDSYLAGKFKIAIAGWDYHRPQDPTNGERIQHLTYVWAQDKLTESSLLSAIKNGQTYASDNGATLSGLNHLPLSAYQKTPQPRISSWVKFPFPVTGKKVIRVYRDGVVQPSSVWYLQSGEKELYYEFVEVDAPLGKHSYILEVGESLITSPINLEVVDYNISKLFGTWQGNGFSFKLNADGTGSYWQSSCDNKIGLENRRIFLGGFPANGKFSWENMGLLRLYIKPEEKFFVRVGPVCFTLKSGGQTRKFYVVWHDLVKSDVSLIFEEPEHIHFTGFTR